MVGIAERPYNFRRRAVGIGQESPRRDPANVPQGRERALAGRPARRSVFAE
jgi:hypothetical protein